MIKLVFSINRQLINLLIEEQSMINESIKKKAEKPYKKLKLVNDVLTVVLNNGDVISKPSCSVHDFQKVSNSESEMDVLKVFDAVKEYSERQKEILNHQKMQTVRDNFDLLRELNDFETDGTSVKLKGINRTMPQLLVEKFIEVVSRQSPNNEDLQTVCNQDVEYIALKRFFMWCCLNPRAEVADELYRFLMENSFRITKQGFFVALRNVVSLQAENGDNTKVQFISNAYNKVKAVWKKKPELFHVHQCGDEFKLIDQKKEAPYGYTDLGNLKDLYLDLPNRAENRFTDDWTKTFDIRIGKIVSMPLEECNWSLADCAAAGLHWTSDEINYVNCGDQSVLIIVNPMKVVGIGEKKGRSYEYFPIMTVSRDEATKILHDLDFDTIDLDEFYVENELESLAEKAQKSFAVEFEKHQFNMPSISSSEIGNIVTALNRMKNELGSRVQEIV